MSTEVESGQINRAGRERADPPTLSVVAPAYNEADNLRPFLTELIDVLDALSDYQPYEVLLVNDGSADETGALIDHAARLYPEVVAIDLSRNFGQTAALAAGINHARGEVVVTLDSDGQNDPGDIPVLLDRLESGFDCVSGWRHDRQDPLAKRVPSRIQTRLAKLTGPDINDFGCTLKAYRREALGEICLYGEGHRYIPAKLHDAGFSVTEVPVNHRPRENGASKYGTGRLIRGFVDLVWHVLWNRYSTRPFHLFGGVGFVLMAVGGIVGVAAVAHNWIDPAVGLQPYLPQLLLAVGMVLFGLLTAMFGTIMEFLTRIYYEDRQEYRIERVIE